MFTFYQSFFEQYDMAHLSVMSLSDSVFFKE